MNKKISSHLPFLGFGLGLRTEHYNDILESKYIPCQSISPEYVVESDIRDQSEAERDESVDGRIIIRLIRTIQPRRTERIVMML